MSGLLFDHFQCYSLLLSTFTQCGTITIDHVPELLSSQKKCWRFILITENQLSVPQPLYPCSAQAPFLPFVWIYFSTLHTSDKQYQSVVLLCLTYFTLRWCLVFLLILCWLLFMWTRHRLETYRKKDLSWENALTSLLCGKACGLLINGWCGWPIPQEVVPPLGKWFWMLWESRLSKPWEEQASKQASAWLLTSDSYPMWAPILISLHYGLQGLRWNKPSFAHIAFGLGVLSQQ